MKTKHYKKIMKETATRVTLTVLMLLTLTGSAFAGGKIVQMAMRPPGGGLNHIVNVVNIEVSEDDKNSTVEIRDTDGNTTKTSTLTVDIASGEITGHTGGQPDYTGWTVVSIWEINESGARSVTADQTTPSAY